MSQFINVSTEDKQARALLQRVSAFGDNQSKPMKIVALGMEQRVRQAFRDESDPWGSAWPVHSPVTLAERRRRGQTSVQKLIDTGKLYASIERNSDSTSATVSAGEWAEVHQFGNPSNRAWGRSIAPIPARPSFPIRQGGNVDLTDDWVSAITAPLESELQKVVK